MRSSCWSRSALVIAFGSFIASASAYQVKETQGGAPIRWADGEVVFEIAMRDVPEGVLPPKVERAVGAAIDTWSAEMPLGVELMGQAVREVPDSGNVVTWVHEGWDDQFDVTALAMTLTTYDPSNGRIKDTDVYVNAEQFAWETDRNADDDSICTGGYDVENVLTHELGHALGLAHEDSLEEATMFPRAASCEVKKRDLDADDMAGVTYLYSQSSSPRGGDGDGGGGAMPVGCRVAPRGRSSASTCLLFAIVMGLLFLRRRRRALPGLAVTLAAGMSLAASPATATTVRRASLEEIGARSAVIARGVVLERRVVEVKGRLYTDHLVAVTEQWKGPSRETVVVRLLGGEKDGVGMVAEGVPVLSDDELLLFLRPRSDGAWTVTALSQGAFRIAAESPHATRVVAGRGERFDLETLRRATTGR